MTIRFIAHVSAFPSGIGSRFQLLSLDSTVRDSRTFYSVKLKQIQPVDVSETSQVELIIKVCTCTCSIHSHRCLGSGEHSGAERSPDPKYLYTSPAVCTTSR